MLGKMRQHTGTERVSPRAPVTACSHSLNLELIEGSVASCGSSDGAPRHGGLGPGQVSARALGLRCKQDLIEHPRHQRHHYRASKPVMAMARVLHLWNEWEIQILVLISFALQVFLLSFAWMRRRSISHVLTILLWLMYLLAEYTATYTLGHMSIGCKAGRHQQLMAFWAPFLLVHLGGQDTITAYAMEDSQLWLRHLLTFAVQALGAGYVLYKHIGSRGSLVAPAVLMFVVGVLKNVERVWALNFSRLETIRRYLNGVSIKKNDGDYPTAGTRSELDDESVLQGAHDLLYICMGQFVDDKICPTKFQNNAMELFHEKCKTFELVEMQLSLMYDIFYTKAAVIHTWYGHCFRAISLLGTALAFFLFQFSTAGQDGYNRVDVAVTYILVTGALILEAASLLRAMGSTWTCAMLRANKWDRLHSLHVSLRRCVRIAQARRWSGSIGQLNVLGSTYTGDETSGATATPPTVSSTINLPGVQGTKDGSDMIPADAKELVLEEIRRMVEACEGKESLMRSYRGQCALEQPDRCIKPDHRSWSFPDGFFKDLTTWSTSMEFDESILAWHLATSEFLIRYLKSAAAKPLVEATNAVSNYMMFLFVDRPNMLPYPVRPTLHLQARKVLGEWRHYWRFMNQDRDNDNIAEALGPAAELTYKLLRKQELDEAMPEPKLELLRVVFGVWVEMLCYAAHHCGRRSHARQLNNGGEFITIVWLLTTVEFNRVHYEKLQFKEREPGSIWNFMNFVDFAEFIEAIILKPLLALLKSCGLCHTCGEKYIRRKRAVRRHRYHSHIQFTSWDDKQMAPRRGSRLRSALSSLSQHPCPEVSNHVTSSVS